MSVRLSLHPHVSLHWSVIRSVGQGHHTIIPYLMLLGLYGLGSLSGFSIDVIGFSLPPPHLLSLVYNSVSRSGSSVTFDLIVYLSKIDWSLLFLDWFVYTPVKIWLRSPYTDAYTTTRYGVLHDEIWSRWESNDMFTEQNLQQCHCCI